MRSLSLAAFAAALVFSGAGVAHADTHLVVDNHHHALTVSVWSDWSTANGAGDQCQVRVTSQRTEQIVADTIFDPATDGTFTVKLSPGTYEVHTWCMNEAGPFSNYEATTTAKVTGANR